MNIIGQIFLKTAALTFSPIGIPWLRTIPELPSCNQITRFGVPWLDKATSLCFSVSSQLHWFPQHRPCLSIYNPAPHHVLVSLPARHIPIQRSARVPQTNVRYLIREVVSYEGEYVPTSKDGNGVVHVLTCIVLEHN